MQPGQGAFAGPIDMHPVDLSLLSLDARAVAAAWFSMFGSASVLNFEMRESRPSRRSADALAELVEKGVISIERHPGGAISYRPLQNCRNALGWYRDLPEADKRAVNWPLVESILSPAA